MALNNENSVYLSIYLSAKGDKAQRGTRLKGRVHWLGLDDDGDDSGSVVLGVPTRSRPLRLAVPLLARVWAAHGVVLEASLFCVQTPGFCTKLFH